MRPGWSGEAIDLINEKASGGGGPIVGNLKSKI